MVNMIPLFFVGLFSVSHALIFTHGSLPTVCLECCGPSPCCSDCGLNPDLLSLLKPVVGTQVDGKQVVSTKRAVDDLFPDPDQCLDCCGQHPCCHDCGLGNLFGHGSLIHPFTTEAPKSPEQNENYGEQSPYDHLYPNGGLTSGGLGLPQLGPDTDLGPAKPYWEELFGKKK